ncbi:hypothetical protein BC332_11327 [Capsicum chinense]|nr:hypothetical protein BC332_11327 [Capsicum chinense]
MEEILFERDLSKGSGNPANSVEVGVDWVADSLIKIPSGSPLYSSLFINSPPKSPSPLVPNMMGICAKLVSDALKASKLDTTRKRNAKRKVASSKSISPPKKVVDVEKDEKNKKTKIDDDIMIFSHRKSKEIGDSKSKKSATPNTKGSNASSLTRMVHGVEIFLDEMLLGKILGVSVDGIRGTFNVLFKLTIALGILIANIINFLSNKIPDGRGWRISLGGAAVPAIVIVVLSVFLSDSPRLLIERENIEKAELLLKKIRGVNNMKYEFKDLMELSISGIRALFWLCGCSMGNEMQEVLSLLKKMSTDMA